MEKNKKKSEKEVSRREFVKKMAYLAPAVAVLVIPKRTIAAACSFQCPGGSPPGSEGLSSSRRQ